MPLKCSVVNKCHSVSHNYPSHAPHPQVPWESRPHSPTVYCASDVVSAPILTQDQLEDVVRDEVAAGGVSHQVEGLGEVHGSLLVVNLRVKTAVSGGLGAVEIASINIPAEHQSPGSGRRPRRCQASGHEWRPDGAPSGRAGPTLKY